MKLSGTPAVLTQLEVGHSIGTSLPERPAFVRKFDFDQDDLITPNQAHYVELAYHLELTELQRTALLPSRQSLGQPSFPLQVDGAVSKTEIKAVHSPDLIAQRGEILADFSRPMDGRVYTIVGTLSAPGATGNVVPRSRGQFRAQSGKTYVALGVDWGRAPRNGQLVVIRAERESRDGEFVVLNVKDVLEPQEP